MLAAACAARAQANVVELCPAEFAGSPQVVDASDLGVQLESDGPRSVSGSLLMLTATGWYQADFTSIALAQTSVKGNDGGVIYTRNPYRSVPVYVGIPNAASVLAVFIAQAQAVDDPAFGWDKRGMVACDPPSDPRPGRRPNLRGEPVVTLPPPVASSLRIAAQPIAAPPILRVDCDKPFAPPTMTSHPDLEVDPNDIGVRGRFVVYVRVALSEHGDVIDAWPYVSSGYKVFDDGVVAFARRATYSPARSFCMPVRGFYLYRMQMGDYYRR